MALPTDDQSRLVEQAHRRELLARIREHQREIDRHNRGITVAMAELAELAGLPGRVDKRRKPMSDEELKRSMGL